MAGSQRVLIVSVMLQLVDSTGHFMQTIQASEAKTRFLRILDDVERGETVIITRHGKPVARIIPQAEIERERVQRAMEGMRALRKRIGKFSLEEILSARDEGRA
jgi:prevent-host-death family protein